MLYLSYNEPPPSKEEHLRSKLRELSWVTWSEVSILCGINNNGKAFSQYRKQLIYMKDYVEYNPISPKSKIQLTEKGVESLLKLLRKGNAGFLNDSGSIQGEEKFAKKSTVKHEFYRVGFLVEKYQIHIKSITHMLDIFPDLFVLVEHNKSRVWFVKDGKLENFFSLLGLVSRSVHEAIVKNVNLKGK